MSKTTEEVKTHPILFSGPMVRAILDGKKTQTRRVVKIGAPYGELPILEMTGPHTGFEGEENARWTWIADHQAEGSICVSQDIHCPYGQPGDRLWVRETWSEMEWTPLIDSRNPRQIQTVYRAGPHPFDKDHPHGWHEKDKWKPSIHMRREASRITLEVAEVRVERLQEMSEYDLAREGFDNERSHAKCLRSFVSSWDALNAKRGFPWSNNDWVWVTSFKRLEKNQ